LVLRSREASKAKAELARARELAEYKFRSAAERSAAALEELKRAEERLNRLMKRLRAAEGETPEAAAARASKALEALHACKAEASAAAEKAEFLRAMVSGENDEIEGETKLSRAEAEAYMKQILSELEKAVRELDRGEGGYSRLGDPLLLSTEEKRLEEEIARLELEYRALDLAILL
jgi:cysteinyl-tRNA synthetase